MIKSVIFDYGNVISFPNPLTYCDELERKTGVPASVFKKLYDRIRSEYDRGTITGEQMYSQLLEENGYDRIAADKKLMAELTRIDLESWSHIRPDVTEWGLTLQKSGYKLGILSNMPTEFLDLYEKQIPLFTAADYACFSCRLHLIKPEKTIYRVCLEKLGVAPDEAVFFDDIKTNVDAANILGIHGCLWTGLDQGKKDWQQFIGS